MMKTQLQLLLLVLSVGLMGCSDSDSDRDTSPDDTITEPPVEEFSYDATLTRTEYGVPHIVA